MVSRSNVVRLDQHGGVSLPELSKKDRKQLLGGEIGTAFDMYTRLFSAFSGGDVFEIGEWRARDIDTMLSRDGTARQVEQVLTLPIRGTKFSLEGQKGDTGELDLVEEQLYTPAESGGLDPGMQLILGQLSGGSVYKKAFFEKQWGLDDDETVRLQHLAWRPPSTCEVRRDEHTARMNGFRQRAWWFYSSPGQGKQNFEKAYGKDFTGYLDIPKIRSYVYIHGQHRAPLTGISDMDIAYWCYKQKQKLLFLWFQFLENQSLPKLAVYGSDQDQADDAAAALAAMRSSAVGGFVRPPQGGKLFDVIEAAGSGAAQFTAAINFLDNYQTGSVLAGFLNLPSAAALGRGSYALSESQTQFFQQSRQGVIDEICTSFTHDVSAPIVVLNRGKSKAIPKLIAEPISDTDAAQLIATFTAMVQAPALRIPDQFVDMLATKVATKFDLPMGQVAQMITNGAKVRAEKALLDSPSGATPEGQAAAELAGALDATFTVLGQVNGQPPGANDAMGVTPEALGGGSQLEGSMRGDLQRG
jgi:hypothetical protein